MGNITHRDRENAEAQIKGLQIPYDYDTKEYPIEVLLYKFGNGLVNDGASIYIPDYQRKFVWTEYEMSRFIESLLLGVPIQPIFASLNDTSGHIEVIDGSQRIRTISHFVNGDLILKDLKKLTEFNGFSYDDLSPSRRNKFQTISLRFQIISDRATEEIKQDIFYRLNTSGNKASPSEIRKGSFAGDFYNFIIESTKNPLFMALAPSNTSKTKRGNDEELVLRFFAYSEVGEIPGRTGKFLLDNYVQTKNENGFDKAVFEERFVQMLRFVEAYFPHGFRKSASSQSTPRVRFEAISIGVYLALQYSPNLIPASMQWLQSYEFHFQVASDGSNNSGRLTSRVNFVRDCLIGKIDSSKLLYGF